MDLLSIYKQIRILKITEPNVPTSIITIHFAIECIKAFAQFLMLCIGKCALYIIAFVYALFYAIAFSFRKFTDYLLEELDYLGKK